MESDNDTINTHQIIEDLKKDKKVDDKPWLWKKGVSANPKGRPKGKTMKDYVREYLACMNDEERENFMDGLPKELIWKMAEGNPKETTDLSTTSKIADNLTEEEIQLAQQLINERRSKTITIESKGSISDIVD